MNLTDEEYSVSVQTERNGEQIHDNSYQVGQRGQADTIKRTWPCDPATFVVRARTTNDDEPFEVSFTEEAVFDPDILVERGGRASVTHNTVGENECME